MDTAVNVAVNKILGPFTANITSKISVYLQTEVNSSLPSHLSAWAHRVDTQCAYDLDCAAPFKNLSPHCRALYKSEDVDWDLPSWLLAQGLEPVMNAAIICWCMKREVHHHLLHIKPWQSFSALVTAPLALGGGMVRLALSLKVSLRCGPNRLLWFACASRNRLMCSRSKHIKYECDNSFSHWLRLIDSKKNCTTLDSDSVATNFFCKHCTPKYTVMIN